MPVRDKSISWGFARIGSITHSSHQLNIGGMMVRYNMLSFGICKNLQCRCGNGSYYNIYVAQVAKLETSKKYILLSPTNTNTQWTRDLKTQEIHVFIGEIEKWFWNLKNITSASIRFKCVTFEKVHFPTSLCDSAISINSLAPGIVWEVVLAKSPLGSQLQRPGCFPVAGHLFKTLPGIYNN